MNSDVFLILFITILALIGLGPLLMRKLKVPGVISLLIVGMIIGPNGLNLINYLTKAFGFLGAPPEQTAAYFTAFISSLGSLGLIFLMAQAGMEADFKMIRTAKKPVILLSVLTFLIPAAAGYFVYAYFRADDFPGKLLYASLFASHSVGIAFPVIREMGLTKTKFGASVLISTVVTDISSIILLAVSVQLKRQELGAFSAENVRKTLSIFDYIDPHIFGSFFMPFFLLLVVLYLLIATFIVYRIGSYLLKIFKPSEELLITLLLLVILFTVLIGEFMGINLVVGAFIAGLALSRLVKDNIGDIPLITRFESIGYGLLIPFLFISIGMQTDFSAFAQSGNVKIILLTVCGLVFSKIFSGWLALRLSGFDNTHSFCAGLMTVPQLSATLAAAALGKEFGMLDNNFFNAIIVLSIVTTLPVPTLVRIILDRTHNRMKADLPNEFSAPEVVKQDDLL